MVIDSRNFRVAAVSWKLFEGEDVTRGVFVLEILRIS